MKTKGIASRVGGGGEARAQCSLASLGLEGAFVSVNKGQQNDVPFGRDLDEALDLFLHRIVEAALDVCLPGARENSAIWGGGRVSDRDKVIEETLASVRSG